MISPAFDPPPDPRPANVRYGGANLDDPAWALPFVLVGMSSTYQAHQGLLNRVVDALAGLPVTALITLGPAIQPAEVHDAANVTVVRSAPHSQLLPHSALVVTHAGHGSVMKAPVDRRSARLPAARTRPGRQCCPRRRRRRRCAGIASGRDRDHPAGGAERPRRPGASRERRTDRGRLLGRNRSRTRRSRRDRTAEVTWAAARGGRIRRWGALRRRGCGAATQRQLQPPRARLSLAAAGGCADRSTACTPASPTTAGQKPADSYWARDG